MPSKTKKHSKTASKLSNSNSDEASSPLSSSSSTPHPDPRITEEELRDSLEEVSTKYPSLIGRSAFFGRLTDVDSVSDSDSRGCKIWLSEASMVAFSLAPGSIVSISVASSGTFSRNFRLSSLAEECTRHFGVNSAGKIAGNYFALATVLPSSKESTHIKEHAIISTVKRLMKLEQLCSSNDFLYRSATVKPVQHPTYKVDGRYHIFKVLKNGVRLSSNLLCTLGSPSSGSTLFVYPIQSRPITGIGNGINMTVDSLSLYDCNKLFLVLVSSTNGFTLNSNMVTHMGLPAENGNVLSSPKTPSILKSKLSSPGTSLFTSSRFEESESSSPNPCGISFDSFDVREVLRDESAKNLLQTCATSWLCSRSLLCGNLVTIPILSKLCIFQVIGASKMSENKGLNPNLFNEASGAVECVDGAFLVGRETKVHLYSEFTPVSETPQKGGLPCLELEGEDCKASVQGEVVKLGGLSREYAVLKDIIISSSVKSTLSSLGLRPIKGVLLHGPPGTGKTSLARLCARDAGVNLFCVNGPEIVSQYSGESEQALHDIFDSASRASPAVVFIDELDAIAPTRKEGGEELSQRMVATLLNLMDGISRTDGLLVIAATNRPDSVEPALRRPGRLDREIEIGVPSPKQRYDILLALLSEMEHSLLDMQVQHLATTTHGFVGADLAALCNEAALVCLRRYVDFKKSRNKSDSNKSTIVCGGCSAGIAEGSNCSKDSKDLFASDNVEYVSSSLSELHALSETESEVNVRGTGTSFIEKHILKLAFEDFEKARMKVRPSAMREVILEVPKVSWEDVGGQTEIKVQLMEAVEWPQKHREAFKRIGSRPPTGVLLFGPPGCSKTLLARAVASEAGLNFLAVKGPELFSKWVGESEKAVRSLFAKARANAPSIIFFDEIDGLAVIRGKESDGVSVSDRVMSQLLVELDGLQQRVNVTVIAATNRPDKIDPALLRPGRFDRLLYVGPPNETDREDIFRIHLYKMPCSSDVCIKELSLLTEGFTGADISLLCHEAAVAAIEERLDASEITMQHLKTAINQVQPSEIQSYRDLSAKFQRHVYSSSARERLGYDPCSRKSKWIPFWSLIKTIVLYLYRFPAALSQPKSSSSG